MTKRLFIFYPLLLLTSISFAQKKLPVVKATSIKAYFMEGKEERHNWNISPEIPLDIHITTKISEPKWISFYTDVDSIKVKLKPNENFDFIVLLNSKDTCMTRIQALPFNDFSKINPAIHDTIPFELTAFNNIKIKAILNKKDSLNLMFDSATNGLLLTEAAIKEKNLETEIEKKENILQFGNQTFDSLEIYSVLLNGQGYDGRFGWDLFNGKVVEIDYDKNIFVVHSQLPKIDEGYAKLKLEHIYNSFCIEAELQIKNKKFKNRFLFDTGYQRTIMLDTALVDEQNYPKDLPIIKKVMMRNGAGVELPVITFNNEKLNIGNSTLFDIPVQLLNNQQVVKYKAHILGNEVLKRFNTIYDFHKDVVYLKPNSLANLEYTDAKL